MNKEIFKHLIRYILIIFIIAVCCIIFKFSSENGEESSNTSEKFVRLIVILSNKELSEREILDRINVIQPYLRKIAHFSTYTILGILCMSCALTFKGNKLLKFDISFIFNFLYACTDEFHQLLVPGRRGEFRDVAIDSFGALLGIIIVLIIASIVKSIILAKERKIKSLAEKNEIGDKKRNVLFIASTGGHLNELMQVKSLFNKFNYHIITEKTAVDDSLKEEYGEKIRFLIYGTKKYPVKYIFKFIANCFISLYYYFKFQPEVIVTTGTHTAVPMCYIAKIFGSKIIFIETFANRTTRTVAGTLVYPIADTFVVQWEEMKKVYPKAVCWGWLY